MATIPASHFYRANGGGPVDGCDIIRGRGVSDSIDECIPVVDGETVGAGSVNKGGDRAGDEGDLEGSPGNQACREPPPRREPWFAGRRNPPGSHRCEAKRLVVASPMGLFILVRQSQPLARDSHSKPQQEMALAPSPDGMAHLGGWSGNQFRDAHTSHDEPGLPVIG